MVIRPYGYAVWEAIQDYLNVKFKETDHSNILYPTLFIEKEASHVEGFSSELALVTIGRGKELEEKLVVGAISDTIVNHMFTQWIHSYRDLPCRAIQMIDVYLKFAYEQAEIPVIAGRKSKVETFAGAVSFTDGSGERQHVRQTSWVVSTPFVVVIIPIWKKDDDSREAAGNKVKLDGSEQRTSRWKFNFWEMKVSFVLYGVPLGTGIGPHDVSRQSVVVSRTDAPGKQRKVFGISMEPFEFAGLCDGQVGCIFLLEGKWARGPWSASNEEELKVKEETGATIRCSPFERPQGIKRCLMARNPAEEVSIFAKSIRFQVSLGTQASNRYCSRQMLSVVCFVVLSSYTLQYITPVVVAYHSP
ncbi:proline--tRNA ligase-like [Pyrus ussuriensis x Pyrus communis]|uniref:Proline--tRNA ligase-like n=1 Tax=Pyrus ussuriensis x Pyrus communis TaxID=2448454 RepID=A0A5N5FLE0_9ROSA|nr:proline--tRNA ligase-like [Pyrus ussuriensis x Pyrus communis]